jgi:DNA-binding CsgD family transcriptional regulator
MSRVNLGRALAAMVASVAVLNTVSALSMPVRDRKADPVLVLIWLGLLLAHAALYLVGDRVRARWSLRSYTLSQAVLLFAVAVTRAPAPVTIALFMAATAEIVVLAEAEWKGGAIGITVGAIALFVLAALITSNLYRATTGLRAHAAGALLHRPNRVAVDAAPPVPRSTATINGVARLSERETDVLRELVTGARNSDIAVKLGITERTVKTHLGSIYQKLGVETRSAAVAAAVQQKLV